MASLCSRPRVDTARPFVQFSSLPSEIRLQIFQHAIPDPRSLHGVILLVVGRDLGRARAILPSIRSLKQCYQEANPDADFHVDNDHFDDQHWDPVDDTMVESRRFVLDLMRTCRLARFAALERFRLDLSSTIPEENLPWWDPDLDNIYFQQPYYDVNSRRAMLYWLATQRQTPSSHEHGVYFKHIQHVTLCLDFALAAALALFGPGENELDGGLLSLPQLESVTLLLDPGSLGGSVEGNILYYESEDFHITVCGRKRPEEVQVYMRRLLERIGPRDRVTPDVNIFVMGLRTSKGSQSDALSDS